MRRIWLFVVGMGLGAGIMYLLDPHSGNRRRALLRDKTVHYSGVAREKLAGSTQQLRDRSFGMLARLRYQLNRIPPSDEVLTARVRSKLGRVVSHPHAIEVTAHSGQVVMRGPILADEVDQAMVAVRLIPGVTGVVNQLEVFLTPDGVPGLQGTTASHPAY